MMQKKEIYEEHFLSKKEKRLMEVLFQGGATEQDIVLFTENLDVDTASSDYMLMLSYLGTSMQWKWFPKQIVPRLQGLHRYYQVRNAMGIKGLLHQIDILSGAGIPVMLIKGMAMRYHYAAGVPRIMSDMDLLVPEEKFEQAVRLLCASGGTDGGRSAHSIHIVNGISSIDLHCWLFKHHGEKNVKIWEGGWTLPVDFYGRTVYVLSPEDMFVHQLDTRARAIFQLEAESRRMRWLYDCRRICEEKNFDWELVMQRIRQFHIENTSYFMLKAFADCFPELLSESFIEKSVTPAKDYERWLKQRIRYRKFLQKFHRTKQEKAFWYYISLWPRMHYYKYEQRKYEANYVEGRKLSVAQYLKEAYHQETIWGCIKTVAKRADNQRKQYAKGNDGE